MNTQGNEEAANETPSSEGGQESPVDFSGETSTSVGAEPIYSFESDSDAFGYTDDDNTITLYSEGEEVGSFDTSDMTPDQVEDLRRVVELGQEVLPILKKLELFYHEKLNGKFTLDAYNAKLLFTFIMHQEAMNESLQMQYAVVAHKADSLQEELDQLQTRKLWRPKS